MSLRTSLEHGRLFSGGNAQLRWLSVLRSLLTNAKRCFPQYPTAWVLASAWMLKPPSRKGATSYRRRSFLNSHRPATRLFIRVNRVQPNRFWSRPPHTGLTPRANRRAWHSPSFPHAPCPRAPAVGKLTTRHPQHDSKPQEPIPLPGYGLVATTVSSPARTGLPFGKGRTRALMAGLPERLAKRLRRTESDGRGTGNTPSARLCLNKSAWASTPWKDPGGVARD